MAARVLIAKANKIGSTIRERKYIDGQLIAIARPGTYTTKARARKVRINPVACRSIISPSAIATARQAVSTTLSIIVIGYEVLFKVVCKAISNSITFLIYNTIL